MKAQDFYFQIGVHPKDEYCPVTFLITPKAYYDVHTCLDDSGDEPDNLPEGFSQMSESCFEYNGLPSAGRKKLIDVGAMEYRMFPDNEGAITPIDVAEADRAYSEHQGRGRSYEDMGDGMGEDMPDEEDMEEEGMIEAPVQGAEDEEEENLDEREDVIEYQNRLKENRIHNLKEDLRVAIGADAFEEAAKIRDEILREETNGK